jgi:hypothetical protein
VGNQGWIKKESREKNGKIENDYIKSIERGERI